MALVALIRSSLAALRSSAVSLSLSPSARRFDVERHIYCPPALPERTEPRTNATAKTENRLAKLKRQTEPQIYSFCEQFTVLLGLQTHSNGRVFNFAFDKRKCFFLFGRRKTKEARNPFVD